jgi:hypothetical protein
VNFVYGNRYQERIIVHRTYYTEKGQYFTPKVNILPL